MAIDKSLNQAPLGLGAMDPLMKPETDQDDIEIEIEDPESVEINMGDLEIDLEPSDEKDDEFNDNLAEHLDNEVLATLAGDLLGDIDS
jgi:hypothetical protein